MRKSFIFLIALLAILAFALSACGGEPAAEPKEPVQIRWFVGLGTGTDAHQIEIQQQVVDAFNASQENITLVLEVVPYDSARDTLSTQIAAGAGPDIIGPVGIGGSNDFIGQYLDLAPLMDAANYDTSVFNEALVTFYQTEEGQVGLPSKMDRPVCFPHQPSYCLRPKQYHQSIAAYTMVLYLQ